MLIQSSTCPSCGAPIFIDVNKVAEAKEQIQNTPFQFGGNSIMSAVYSCDCLNESKFNKMQNYQQPSIP